jgi:GT2 family glycosyltransferase
MLDADNKIYPSAIGRLVEELDADPGAAFAYSQIEVRAEGEPIALMSALPWSPRQLRRGNYIDAMSLIRRDALLGVGGYSEDIRMYGWEDYDLWCNFAEHGLRGRLHPEILCSYALTGSSMISVTNLDVSDAWRLMRRRYPRTLGGAPRPRHPIDPRAEAELPA